MGTREEKLLLNGDNHVRFARNINVMANITSLTGSGISW